MLETHSTLLTVLAHASLFAGVLAPAVVTPAAAQRARAPNAPAQPPMAGAPVQGCASEALSGQRLSVEAFALALTDLDGDLDVDLVTGKPPTLALRPNLDLHRNDGGRLTDVGDFGPFGAQGGAREILAAHLDGDGDVDLAVAVAASVFVLRNTGAGALAVHDEILLSSQPTTLTSADFDGDGNTDLAAANQFSAPYRVWVASNDGAGNFAPPSEVPSPSPVSAIVAGDLDGDGDADLAIADLNTSVLVGHGDGSFDAPVAVTTSSSSIPSSLRLADVDGDGDLDIVLTLRSSNRLAVLRNSGTGVFSALPEVYSGQSPVAAACADMDTDGDVDVVTANEGFSAGNPTIPELRLLANGGDGTFTTVSSRPGPFNPLNLETGDVDLDGNADVAISTLSAAWVWRGRGNGTLESLRESVVGEFVARIDLDRDHAPDLLVSSGDRLELLRNDRTGTFVVDELTTASYARCASAADLDQDGDEDAVVGSIPLSVFENDGNGAFGPYTGYPVPTSMGPVTSVAIGDLDGDAWPELVCAIPFHPFPFFTGTVVTLANDGSGAFHPYVEIPAGPEPGVVVLADLDDDGDQDVLVGSSSYQNGSVSLLRNLGDGTFLPLVRYEPHEAHSLACADFDRDGDLDVAASTSGVQMLFNDGTGYLAPGDLTDAWGSALIAADLDRDGDFDVVNSGLSVLENAGNGSFVRVTQYEVGAAESLVMADFDLDGDRDVALVTAIGYAAPSTVYVLENLCR